MLHKTDVARFWSKVRITPYEHQCWEWQAGLFDNGYGQFKVNGRSTQAHRFAFAYFNGGGLEQWAQICHKCDNRKCCNPSHLFGGSAKDNTQDAINKNRREPQRLSRSGERSNFAKLTADVVRDIRADYAKGNVTYDILAERYGISDANIGMVIRRDTWKHVNDEQPAGTRGRMVRVLSTPEEFAAYHEWQREQSCEDCGTKRVEGSDGRWTEMWAADTLCMKCSKKREHERCPTCTCHMKGGTS